MQLGSQLSGGRDQEFEARSARQHSETLFPNNNHKRAQLRYKGRRLESTLSSIVCLPWQMESCPPFLERGAMELATVWFVQFQHGEVCDHVLSIRRILII